MDIYPSLPGLTWPVNKTPAFKTRTQKSVSGRELRILDQPNPIWTWTLVYSFLRDGSDASGGIGLGTGLNNEVRRLLGFFLAQQGAFNPFLFEDPTDRRVLQQPLGTGDGTTTQFQLVRTMGPNAPLPGFTEPVVAPNIVSAIYIAGNIQPSYSYSINAATGMMTFVTAPSSGQAVTADFTYYFKVRFADDSLDFSNFMYQLAELKQVKLQSVLL